jgi:hypothetical protein
MKVKNGKKVGLAVPYFEIKKFHVEVFHQQTSKTVVTQITNKHYVSRSVQFDFPTIRSFIYTLFFGYHRYLGYLRNTGTVLKFQAGFGCLC